MSSFSIKSLLKLAPLLLLANPVTAGCFSSGQQATLSEAITAIGTACTWFEDQGVLDAGETRSYCVANGDNRINFKVSLSGSSADETPSTSDCSANNGITANGCNLRGGIRTDGYWTWELDPNEGGC